MAQSTFSVRMDEALKRQFDALCADFGMTASTAFNVFARAVVRERKIPFEIAAPAASAQLDGLSAFQALRAQAQENGVQDMPLDEINEEIRKTRYGEDSQLTAMPCWTPTFSFPHCCPARKTLPPCRWCPDCSPGTSAPC